MKEATLQLRWIAATSFVVGMLGAGPALSQEPATTETRVGTPSTADVAKKLANPLAAMISVPLQLNYDGEIGPQREGDRWTLNVQPVVPFALSAELNLISRTIAPVVQQNDIVPGAGHQFGLGDTVQSLFFSPTAPGIGGLLLGLGPVLLLPTGTDALLSGKKWGAGPTIVVLKQFGPWTVGALNNHIWSFAGAGDRADISSTLLQPFLNYTTPSAWSFLLNTETTYDWKGQQWSVPVHVVASKILKLHGLLVSLGGGVRWWADGPDAGPHGLGFRTVVTLVFPK